ncbi:MAG TPA: M50 family metallopeptidase [Kofleriaceae bacterium]|jgi:hypothetical protein
MAAGKPIAAIPTARQLASKVKSQRLASSARWALVISVIATIAVYRLPPLQFLAYPLILLSTLVHEMGHGMGALLSGGQFDSFHMHGDGSGVAHVLPESFFGAAFECAAGLVGPPLIGALYFVVGRRASIARLALAGTGLFFALSVVLWVRGAFGIGFTAVVATVCIAIAWKASAETARVVLLFLGTQLALATFASSDYLFTDYVSGEMTGGAIAPSDVKIMEMAIGGPYWFWGLVCAVFSVAVLALGAWLYLRRATAVK